VSAAVLLGAGPLTRENYDAVVREGAPVRLDASRMTAHRRQLERRLSEGAVVYGVNTGFGAEATRSVPPERIVSVQRNTLLSSAQGDGPALPERVVRGAMLLKAQSWAQGPPGVRPDLVEALVAMLNAGVTPVVPDMPSTSCADLIQQAHIGLALVGEGEVTVDGERRPARETGLATVELAAKEGGSLVNDASTTIAFAIEAEREATALVAAAERVAAMTLEALGGHRAAFDERLVRLRPHQGILESAAHMRELLAGSRLTERGTRPHDPYCLRCLPQVHGAVRDSLATLREALDVEIGGVGDNPLVFEDGSVLSGGNFHAEPIALPLDAARLALAELATLSQARIQQLVHPLPDVDLPPKLAVDPEAGLGLVMLDTLAIAKVAEIRTSAAPATLASGRVDEMEDHLPMASPAARSLRTLAGLVSEVLAMEVACAAQALDFAGVELASAHAQGLHASVRRVVPFAASESRVAFDRLEPVVRGPYAR
jgi:histidine ammonia-lyase